MLASIPETATVDKAIKAPEVEYAGDKPEFKPIETTKVERAVNTDKDILKVGDLYYMCFQGVWFMASNPNGPWRDRAVPKEIYEIPASSPAHNVTYVTVVQESPTTVVYQTSPYTGPDDCVGLRGVGFRLLLPALRALRWFLPDVLPVLPDLRLQRLQKPVDRSLRTGRWRLRGYCTGAGVAGPLYPVTRAAAYGAVYGSAAVGSAYNPRNGTVARGAAVSGSYGSRGAACAHTL